MRSLLLCLPFAAVALASFQPVASGQKLEPAEAASSFRSVRGTDASSSIRYVLLPLKGKLLGKAPQPESPPRLTAQCTEESNGKQHFELLADLGGGADLRFVSPWRPSPGDLYPPVLRPVLVTMDFVGYTKVKPVRRTWVRLETLPGELLYATPGLRSPNMEPVTVYLQYLRALPTLRLTLQIEPSGTASLEFETSGWLTQIRAEPLCHSSGL